MSFRKSLWLAMFLLALVPVLVLGLVTIQFAGGTVNDMSAEALTGLAEGVGLSFEKQLESHHRELQLIGMHPEMLQAVNLSAQGRPFEEYAQRADAELAEWIDSDPDFRVALLLDQNGIVISASERRYLGNDLGEQPFFFSPLQTVDFYVGSVTPSALDAAAEVIYVALPLRAENSLGVLALEVNVGLFDRLLAGVGLGETGASIVNDENGIILGVSDPALRRQGSYLPEVAPLVHQYQEGAIPRSGSMTYVFDGGERLMGYYVIEQPGWLLFSRQLVSEIGQPVQTLLRLQLVVLAAVLVSAFIVCGYLLRKFSRPLAMLRGVFQKAVTQNSYLPCDAVGNNEFSELAAGYNIMIRKLEAGQKETEKLAIYDAVTGIYNRTYFVRRMDEILSAGLEGGVLFLDVDGFKHVNEVFGYAAGDACLVELSRRISDPALELDTVIRQGGDEFFLVKLGSKEQVETVAAQVIELMRKPYETEGISLTLTASIGLVIFPEDGENLTAIMSNTDVAMYRAKEAGKDRYVVYNPAMTAMLRRQMDILHIMQSAIHTGEAFLVFQPEVSFDTGKTIAFETLMRLNSKRLGPVSPTEFIPIAENSREIITIGRWVLESACRYARHLLDIGADFQMVSVNVSAVQLEDSHFLDSVRGALQKTGLPPSCLQIEITESILISKYEENIGKLSMLRFFGVSTALDDFGTGYSSLNYLTQLPVDTLKIDKSFIYELIFSKKTQTICRMIIDMAHTLGMRVVAEGIEFENQRALLADMGCDILQGYLCGRPLPEDELERLLLSGEKLMTGRLEAGPVHQEAEGSTPEFGTPRHRVRPELPEGWPEDCI